MEFDDMNLTDDGYTQTPNKLRIFSDIGADHPWNLDAIDTRVVAAPGRHPHPHTEQVWTFRTHAEAIEAMPDFAYQLAEYLPAVRKRIEPC